MNTTLRAFVLVLIVLIEALSSAWAFAPMPVMTEQAAVEAMPCHDEGSVSFEMSCCDDPSDCHCIAGCFGTVAALVPRAVSLSGFADQPLSATPAVRKPLPALPDRLFRPPAVLLN